MPTIVLKPTEHNVTPIDEKKKAVSEILKRVDQFIKKNELDRALSELTHAKEIDPRNVYALAFEERITMLKEEQQKKNTTITEKHDLLQTEPSPRCTHPTSTQEHMKTSDFASSKYQEQTLSDTRTQEGYAEPKHPATDHTVPPMQEKHPTNEELQRYYTTMVEALRSGKGTSEIEAVLSEMRKQFNISNDIHQLIRQEALKYIIDHSPKTTQSPMKESQNRQSSRQREKILVIDDDPKLLNLLTQSLTDHGYDVIALTTSDEAYALLRKFTPDLILCDINLETSTMGGFTFYEKIQEFKHLHHVPFIFLTGLTDAAIVRTGKEIGVDDYLTKPITEDTLLATIRGKLKRFKQLQRFFTQQHTVALATP